MVASFLFLRDIAVSELRYRCQRCTHSEVFLSASVDLSPDDVGLPGMFLDI